MALITVHWSLWLVPLQVPPSMPTRQMLSIGDSIAAGFGVMCANSTGGGLNPYQFENAQLTAPSRLGGMFGAGVTIIAESGGGEAVPSRCLLRLRLSRPAVCGRPPGAAPAQGLCAAASV